MSCVYFEVFVYACRLLGFGFVCVLISFVSVWYTLGRSMRHTVESVFNKPKPPERSD